jgi:hypothetical protein
MLLRRSVVQIIGANDTQIYLVLRFKIYKLKKTDEIMKENRIKRFNENSELNISDVRSSNKNFYIVERRKDNTMTEDAKRYEK